MRNRKKSSCEAALRAITDLVQTVWDVNKMVSLLALDNSGAFDGVNHIRLLDVLQRKGLPFWLVRWVKSFLTDRSTTLQFDGYESTPPGIRAGASQGLPLSPILFILFSLALYDSIREVTGDQSVGFADNTTSYAGQRDRVCTQLQDAHEVCVLGARSYGVKFDVKKYQLVHFIKGKKVEERSQRIGDIEVKAKGPAKVLGAMVDQHLKGDAQIEYMREKMRTQKLAIERTIASVWGPSMGRSRVVYNAAIRSAVGYGSPIWHSITGVTRPRSGIYKELGKLQRRAYGPSQERITQQGRR